MGFLGHLPWTVVGRLCVRPITILEHHLDALTLCIRNTTYLYCICYVEDLTRITAYRETANGITYVSLQLCILFRT